MIPYRFHRLLYWIKMSISHRGDIADWQVKVTEYMPYLAAIVSKDSVLFREFRTRGAVHSAKVSVTQKGKPTLYGWVSAGSIEDRKSVV